MKRTKKHTIGVYVENEPEFVEKINEVSKKMDWTPSTTTKNLAKVGWEVLRTKGFEGFFALLNKSSDV